MLRHSLRGLAVAAVAAFTLGPVPAAAVTPVDTCRDLDKAGETYIVTDNITAAGDCLVVLADRITLDLGGNTITGPGADTFASGVSDNSSVRTLTVVKNGSITNFGSGIALASSTRNTVRNVTASNNFFGMQIGPNSLVKDCIVQGNGNTAVSIGDGGQVEGCLIGGTDSNGNSNGNGGFGIFAGRRMLITKNTVIRNGFNGGVAGLVANFNSTVTHNTVNENVSDGIFVAHGLVTYNTANDNGEQGIVADVGSTVTNNTANGNTEDGIKAFCPSTVTNTTASGNGALNFNFVDFFGPCFEKNNTSPPPPAPAP